MDNPLEKRISDLEEQLSSLKKIVADLTAQKTEQKSQAQNSSKTDISKPFTAAPKPTIKKAANPVAKDPAKSGEIWIGRLGIGLLLFGAIFLFKYSIDQGWITPLVRVLFGFSLGIVLLIAGLRLYEKKKALSRLLLGGGIASYYITIFSAFQLYNLLSHSVAFVLMAIVTIIAFLLALKQNEHTLSLIGALGGFLTPFLLYTGESNTIGLVIYTSLLVIGSCLTYMARGWRLLLWLSSWAAWIIWAVAIDTTPSFGYMQDKLFIQSAIILSWLAFGVLPAIREYWRIEDPGKWQAPALEFAYKKVSKMAGDTFNRHLHLMVLATPTVALTATRYTWDFSHEGAGYINLIVSLIYILVFVSLRKKLELQSLNFTHGLTGIIIFTWAILLILDDTAQFISMGLESWALFVISKRINDDRLEKFSKLLLALTSFILLSRVFVDYPEMPLIFNAQALADILFIGLLAHAATRMKFTDVNLLFYIFAHIGLMGWLLRELSDFDNGQGLVTITWGILAITIFILGLRQGKTQLRHLGSVTIVIVVAKLFLVDLSELETIWRIILFLGFGGLLLFVSYFLEKLIKPSKEKKE